MPEYLAPAVYIEEIPSGNKPIEGASTSTAGAVGVTQRGPVNTPTLVTSFGAFNRIFGGFLNPTEFPNNLDALPYAAQGFFNNGGVRLYVTRIVGLGAASSAVAIHGRPADYSAQASLAARAAVDDTSISVDDATDIVDTDILLIADGDRTELATVGGAAPYAITAVRLNAALGADHAIADAVTPQTVTVDSDISGSITGSMSQGGGLALDPAALTDTDIIRLSDSADPAVVEFVTINDAANLGFAEGALLFDHPQSTTRAEIVTLAAGTPTDLSTAAATGDSEVALSSFAEATVGAILDIAGERRVVTHVLQTVPVAALTQNHNVGVYVARQVPLLSAHALYEGAWGDALRVSVRASSIVETTAPDGASNGAVLLILASTFGVNPGTVLAITDTTGAVQRARVNVVDRASGEVELADPLDNDVAGGGAVCSVEFDLTVERLENGKAADSETFEKLALDPASPRYAPKVVGSWDAASNDPASKSGESELIRLADLSDALAPAVAAERRLADPDGAAVWPLAGGADDIANIVDATFIGAASDDPDDRTGIQAMANETSISIVAVPGQTSIPVQKALLIHCEKMRYRFAVIEPEQGSKLAEARGHRQNFDTTRGASYYPWLVIANRFGERGDILKIPPSGHVMGIYARTDIQRGVWKAPANEVVRGILSFETALTKGEQDILNPNHVNCFRDFRTASRGLRLWGARSLSSDPEWKYVNVRRLFLFIEQSLDNGLQFAVFEPNSESLWATVKQSISNFLATIWRDGGLEGTSEEEAFFVNVGFNVTMTQTDIDNGRMIVEVGVAPVKPAEFVIIRISQKTREATS